MAARDETWTGPGASAEVVEARRTSFGGGAEEYDAVRPPWPGPTVAWLLGDPATPVQVLDLGAGTGLGTRTVAGLGHQVLAVDPSPGMLAALRAGLAALPAEAASRVSVHEGPAEELPGRDASVDAVVSFQAWHWFDPERAAAECGRVLRPGGTLGLAWHTWDPTVPWVRELEGITGRSEASGDPDVPELASDGFGPAEHRRWAFEHVLGLNDLVRLADSWSFVRVRPDRDDVLAAVRALGVRVADAHGQVAFPHTTAGYRFRRRR